MLKSDLLIWQRGAAAALAALSSPLVVLAWGEAGAFFFSGMSEAHLSRSAGNGWMWTASPERDYSEPSPDLSRSSGVKEQSSVFSLPGPISKASMSVNLCVCVREKKGVQGDTWITRRCMFLMLKSRHQLENSSHPGLLDQSRPTSVLGIIMAIKDNDSLMCCIDKSH